MPLLVPLCSIPVTRNGRRIIPPVGKAFEFEPDEAKDLEQYTRPANSGDPVGIPKSAVAGSTIVAAARRQREAAAEAAAVAGASAAAAIMAAQKGEAPPAATGGRQRTTKPVDAKAAAEDEGL